MEFLVEYQTMFKTFILSLAYIAMGFGIHVVKKSISDGIHWKRYLFENKARTKLALGVGAFSYLSLILFNPNASPQEFAAIGYIIDSVFNKAPRSDQDEVSLLELREQALREARRDANPLK
jgi:hypothetical protein